MRKYKIKVTLQRRKAKESLIHIVKTLNIVQISIFVTQTEF